MTRVHRRHSTLVLATVLMTGMVVAAQAQTPRREGNIWNHRDHQPTRTAVEQKEKAAGIAPTARQRNATTATENRLDRRLLKGEPQ